MPWKETEAMDERCRFAARLEENLYTMLELCERFGISRTTGYKWRGRFESQGYAGLAERSRVPHSSPRRTPERVEEALVALRGKKPSWGPKKLLQRLEALHPEWELPAISTAARILSRHGLVVKRRRRRRVRHPGRPHVEMVAPNDVWSADFKGESRMGNGRYCYPLTVADGYSRYLLGCQGLYNTRHAGAKPVFRALFREHGLPQEILTDNGVPFAGPNALSGLSRLSAWWIRLGIHPIRIEPGRPSQNGRHERMHRTLGEETMSPLAYNLSAQQRSFNRFRVGFNHERPHDALEGRTPSQIYSDSPRPYPERLPPLDYPQHFEKRKVASSGRIKWRSVDVNVTRTLIGEYVGLEEVRDGIWSVYYGPVLLARLDERDGRLHP